MRTDLKDIYIERAQHMAIVCLTRRDDLQVEFVSDNEAIDLLVYLLEENKKSGVFFGVKTRFGFAAPSVSTDDTRMVATMDNVPFPVCEFVFDMTTDKGYWCWIRQPLLSGEIGPRLQTIDAEYFLSLTNDFINNIVESVRNWYQQRK